MKIRIIVDSGSNLYADEIDRYDIGWIPLHIVYPDGKVILDSPELGENIYDDIISGKLSTSQPTPEKIAQVFEETLRKYDYGIYLAMSSALSGTYMAARMVLSDMKTDRIKVIDSRQITIGVDVLVMRLIDEIQRGIDPYKIEDMVRHFRGRQRFYFLLETLEPLIRGGRIGKAKYIMGSVLKIVPLLVIDEEGYIDAYKKARGVPKVIKMIREYMEGDVISDNFDMHVVIGKPKHKAILPFAEELAEKYGAKIKLVRPLTAIHVGVWGVGVSYIKEG